MKYILEKGNCKAVNRGIVGDRGRSDCNFVDGNDRYYVCYGWISPMTGEPISECRNCCAYAYNVPDTLDETKEYYKLHIK